MSAAPTANIVAIKPTAWEEADVYGGKALWKPLVTLMCEDQMDISEGPSS